MTNKELRKQLKKLPKKARMHVEVFDHGQLASSYGHLLGVSQSEPNVIVLSNRNTPQHNT